MWSCLSAHDCITVKIYLQAKTETLHVCAADQISRGHPLSHLQGVVTRSGGSPQHNDGGMDPAAV